MDSSTIIQLILLLFLLLLSAFFSSAETALTTANQIRIRTLAEDGNKQARRLMTIIGDSSKMLSAILIGNNLVNLSASSIATALAIKLFGSVGAGIATGILTFLILIFGEISPKTIATIHADRLALTYSGVVLALMKLLTPVIFVINSLSLAFLKLLRIDPKAKSASMTEEEFLTIVNVGHETGVIETGEREIIHNVFDFTDSEAKEIMIPRIDMTFISVDADYQELLDIFRETKYTRLPVYEDTNDNVIGIINVKDLLLFEDHSHFSIRDIMREPFFTYEHKNTAELLRQMQSASINFAIVLNEYGTTAGMITLEDLLEEIVGEIHDEYDANEEKELQPLSEHEYLVSASMNLQDVSDALGISLESEDYDTIGGYILEQLEHLPAEGETITTGDGVLLRVEKTDKNRIEKVYIRHISTNPNRFSANIPID
ncbi:MAG: HlyC/CorC family transporter [Lachnospiraceae bacterium]|nr:HlyC/CorC family transporter [Lachnospiraceae bacterium]